MASPEEVRITVVLGCFGALVGRGLTQILSEDQALRIIGVDLDSTALERVVARQAPQVAILDEATADTISALERLRGVHPAIGIVVLAHRPARAYGMRLLAAGASCMSKDVSASHLLTAVRIAADGRSTFASDDGYRVERRYPVSAASSLTPREIEVLEFLSRAHSHDQIAHILQRSPETIRTHSAHIRRKLGVNSNKALIGLKLPIQSEAD